jgi:hypothetical protein
LKPGSRFAPVGLNITEVHASRTVYTLNSIGCAICPCRIQFADELLSELRQHRYRRRDVWRNDGKSITILFVERGERRRTTWGAALTTALRRTEGRSSSCSRVAKHLARPRGRRILFILAGRGARWKRCASSARSSADCRFAEQCVGKPRAATVCADNAPDFHKVVHRCMGQVLTCQRRLTIALP